MTPKRFFNLFVFTLFAALLSLTPALSTRAAPLRYTSITTNTVWDTDRSIDTDVVVQNGASLTINNGVTVYVDTGSPDPAPYAGGLSNKVEIIVENGGALYVDGAILTANTAGSWYGLVFLPGSGGTVAGATIRHGTVGVTIQAASPAIHNNTIQDLRGDDGANPGDDGGWAAGIIISGTSTAQISSNTITNITGGNGATGVNGSAGGNGGRGGDGRAALGIFVMDNLSVPTISDNTIANLAGGNGGWGGWGGVGGNGQAGDPDGKPGGMGGYGGMGGNAIGIIVTGAGANCVIERNTIRDVVGGYAGAGNDGGAGGYGFTDDGTNINGGSGGDGGFGGWGGDGGAASGISLRSSSAVVRDNLIKNALTGGDAAAGGWGGSGGSGGAGYTSSFGTGDSGGKGGHGGHGGTGGSAGNGGAAAGISVQATSTADVRHNTLSAEITGGRGFDGGWGGYGGDGGTGGDADAGVGDGNGGFGGDGGTGGDAGDGGLSGSAYGIMAQFNATPTLARNTVSYLRGGGAAASPGLGGSGGYGGAGGAGSSSGLIGNGGNGGAGGAGGSGAEGSLGGAGTGIFVNATHRIENNLVHNLQGGDSGPGGPGGWGGNGGNGSAGGTGDDGQGGAGGAGGAGGNGGQAGSSGGVFTLGNAEFVNNTISAVNWNATASAGGSGGNGGSGGTHPAGGSASDGVAGTTGDNGDQGSAYGLYIGNGQPVIVNNIVAMPGVGLHQVAGPAPAEYYGIYSAIGAFTPSLDYNLVYGWDMFGGVSANYQDVTPGSHDINADPLFVNAPQGDFSLSTNSPAIDKGTSSYAGLTYPTDDLKGVGRPQNSGHDIGAYEFLIKHYIYLPLVTR